MRTTIEIADDLRMQLIQESARRAERGYSAVVERALRAYFAGGDDNRAERVRALFGADEGANEVTLGDRWRTGRAT